MKKLLMILVLSLLWCTPSFALLNPPIRSYFDKMEKDQWIKYRVYNRCAAVFLYRLKTTDFSDEGGKHAQAIMKAMSDAYYALAVNLHKKILNLEEANYSRAEERLNYWIAYYKTRTLGTYISNDTDACFEISDSDELKELFDDFIKTFAGKERSEKDLKKKKNITESTQSGSKKFKSIFGFSFELPNNYELLAILDGKQILSALESNELKNKINKNFIEAVDLSKSIVPDIWKAKIERYSSQGKIALQTGEGIATAFMGLKEDIEKDGFVKEDLEFLCTDEYHEMVYQTKIPVHECKFINIPNDAEWSFIMVADSTFDVTQGISEKKRRRKIRAQFLIKDSVFNVVGFCKPTNCEKIRKDVDQVLRTISY